MDLQKEQGWEQEYAGFWIRFVAYLIDSLFLAILFLPLQVISGVALFTTMSTEEPELVGAGVGVYLICILIYVIFGLCYMIGMPASKHQGTFGKKIMGIKIVDNDYQRITIGRSALRYLGLIINGFTFYIGYIMAGVHPKKRGLHDVIASTFVIKK